MTNIPPGAGSTSGDGPSGQQLHEHGPRVVAIGGGHGLARSLGAICHYASSITAVVSVADDGGSSGRLRRSLKIPAPGDIRRCLVALTPGPSLLAETLEYRFDAGELEGHPLGNLLLGALSATTGDFVSATRAAGELLGTVGTVLPATAVPVELVATAACGALTGQVAIMATTDIATVALDPPEAAAPPEVIEAIGAADQIVIGPGSLYTSVLAALAPVGIARSISESTARVVYVANLLEQPPETAGYDVARHVAALVAHGVTPELVLYDPDAMPLGKLADPTEPVAVHLSDRLASGHDEVLLAAGLAPLV